MSPIHVLYIVHITHLQMHLYTTCEKKVKVSEFELKERNYGEKSVCLWGGGVGSYLYYLLNALNFM